MRKLISLLLPALLALFVFAPKASASLPAGFEKTKLVTNLLFPTDFAQSPDGRIFILEKTGAIKVFKNGALNSTPFITLSVDPAGEKGLLGIALDPQFSSNHFVYIHYVNKTPNEIRVSRFTESNDQAVPGSELVLLRSTQSLGLIHHAGTVRFGSDGKLWISVGNNGIGSNSQDTSNIHGKILRINKDGSIPSDNPFFGQSGKEQSIWMYGLRNPFRFNFLPDGRPIVGDVGDATWEEIDVGVKGGNFGYPDCEGSCNKAFINPIYQYNHNGGSASVTGGFVYNANQFPSDYQGNYFFGDYAQGFIKRMTFDQNGNMVDVRNFDDTAAKVVELLQTNDGSLYYLQIYDRGVGNEGVIWKISYDPSHVPPTVKASADKTTGDAPLAVNFSSQGTSDPNNKPLTYSWDFGDGATSTGANPSHTYTAKGIYQAKLTVSNGTASASSDPIQIVVGYQYPVASIDTPVASTTYNAGQTISYSGSATDAQDGTLPQSAYSWTMVFHHQTHIHPFLGPINGQTNGTFQIPDSGEPSTDTWYEILLTVTDSKGLQTTVSRSIHPNVVSLKLDSNVQGASLTLNGIPLTTPYTFDSVVGFKYTLDLVSPQQVGGTSYQFVSWSDNGSQTHTITTPSQSTTYTANFASQGSGTGKVHIRIQEFNDSGQSVNFLNGATVKLTDINGNDVFATTASSTITGQDGWIFFDNVNPGTYGLLAYKQGYAGFWKQVDCQTPNGSTQNATIRNANTGGNIAAFDNHVTVVTNVITYCHDLGLNKLTKGNLYLRILQVTKQLESQNSYQTLGFINGATVKLTDTAGNTAIQTQTSTASDGQDGWVFFNNIPQGSYGLLSYKDGFSGFMKQINCNGMQVGDSTIQNQNTENHNASWNNNVQIQAGATTYCMDEGLVVTPANLHFRIQQFNPDNSRANFLNGVTVKLTDIQGSQVVQTATSSAQGSEDGWVFFDNLKPDTYGIMAYKQGLAGAWKEVDCIAGHDTFQNASIQNQNTEGTVAAWDNNIQLTAGQTTYCHDLGLKDASVATKGNLRFRIQQFHADGSRAAFINNVTVKLTDPTGNTLISQTTPTTRNSEDGWVNFDNIDAGTYGVMAYKQGLTGYWKEVDCTPGHDTTQNATIQNSNSENLVAAWDNNAQVLANQTTYCHDLGLKEPATAGNLHFRIQEFNQNGWTGKFLNGITVKLTDSQGQTVLKTSTSALQGTEDGWVFFDNVNPGTYGIMAYKQGLRGIWKEVDCNTPGGSFQNATITNTNTEGNTAAFDNNAQISLGQTTFCHDLGLAPVLTQSSAVTPSPTPTLTPSPTPTPTQMPSPTINSKF